MQFLQHLALLGLGALSVYASPIPEYDTGKPQEGTESGGGIAPWAGNGPEPHVPSNITSEPPEEEERTASTFHNHAVQASAVPLGSIIYSCTVPGTVALTFDDGPFIYTGQVMDILSNNGMQGTFFVNGDNWANIYSENSQALLRRMVNEGHQVGSHTWSHPDLSLLPRDAIVSQMTMLQTALTQILGNYPTYMRSPFFSANEVVVQTMADLGYHVIHSNIDTVDWNYQSESAIWTAVENFRSGLNAGGNLALAHDVHPWTANILVQQMVNEVRNRGLRGVTVGECLGDPRENWYRT
ncbi:MAG: hypothetical protein M1823_006267, partial [Watsoniomyces obsoletus]